MDGADSLLRLWLFLYHLLPHFLLFATFLPYSLLQRSSSARRPGEQIREEEGGRGSDRDADNQREREMMLGKRQRPPMKRTTSLSEITFDLNAPVEAPPSDPQRQTTGYGSCDQRLSLPPAASASASPRVRRHSVDFSDNGGQFLRSCALCKRRLVPSRDIYMYRGDRAFCSEECRQQQMSKDERKEKKCALSSKKIDAATSAAAGPKVAAKGETIAAV